MAMRQPLSFDGVHNFLDTLFGDDLHAKRMKSLTGATLRAIQSASLAVGLIGQGLALARGRLTKHAVKQVDRLLSNQGIDVDALLGHWVRYVVGKRDSITVAMDWTEFDADGQATIMLSVSVVPPRTGHAAGLADRGQGGAEEPSQRLRVSGHGAPGRNPARRCRCAHHGRSRLRRPQALPGADRGTEVRLRHPLSRQHRGHRHRWRDARSGRLGWRRWSRANTARCCGHRRGISGRHPGLRAGERHETAVGGVSRGWSECSTLERWRADTLANGSGDRTGGGQRWTAAARLQALIATAGMDEATRSGWCREQGLYPAELAAWQQDAIAGLGEPRAVSAAEARQDRRRVKDLERELHRKDRALAETAALLVLSKKLSAVFHKDADE